MINWKNALIGVFGAVIGIALYYAFHDAIHGAMTSLVTFCKHPIKNFREGSKNVAAQIKVSKLLKLSATEIDSLAPNNAADYLAVANAEVLRLEVAIKSLNEKLADEKDEESKKAGKEHVEKLTKALDEVKKLIPSLRKQVAKLNDPLPMPAPAGN